MDEGWRIGVEWVPLFRLYTKLKVNKKILKVKNVEGFGGIRQHILQVKERLDKAQYEVFISHGRAASIKK